MKCQPWALLPVLAFLSSCVIVNPVYPQDELNLETYSEPITLDWSNNNEEVILFEDGELARGYLNNPRNIIKTVDVIENVFNGRGALQIGENGDDKAGALSFVLKNTFRADAIILGVRPHYAESFDMFTGKTITTVDRLKVSINDRDYINIYDNDEHKATELTFAFEQQIDSISIKTDSGRAMFTYFAILQKP